MDIPRDRVELTDPRALRALAHPIRLRLVGLLRRNGPLTATQAAELTGESTASLSFHFRQLAKYGLVEEAPGGTGRQRPWQASARATAWPGLSDDPELSLAVDALSGTITDFYATAMRHWVTTRAEEPAEWRQATPFGDSLLYLTPDELAGLSDRIEELFGEYRDRAADPTGRPEGARGVMYLNVAIPNPTEPGRL